MSRCRRRSGPIRSIYQGGSDDLLGPQDDVPVASEEFGIDLEAEIAIITDDVPMGTSPAEARAHISLLTLVNDWSLRNLIPGELLKGFGFYQSKPATSFSPLAVTRMNSARPGTAAGCIARSKATSTASCSGGRTPGPT